MPFTETNAVTVATATVPVKSSWYSKINWTQAGALIAAIVAFFGLPIDPEMLTKVLLGIITGQSVITTILKSWFTRSVTPASMGR